MLTIIGLVVVAGAVGAVRLFGGDEPAADQPLLEAVEGDPAVTYDPVGAGESVPEGFRQVLRRDDIDPVYDPVFVSASEVDWPSDTLIVGVALDGEAHAFPINFLNVHEMVNDWLAGSPILVSW